MRCLTLAHTMRKAGWTCSFITKDSSKAAAPALESSGFPCFSDDFNPAAADLLVVDHYGLDHEYEKKARLWTKSTLVIDDLANRQHDCDILLDQTWGRQFQDYAPFAPKNCLFLLGPNFALLREEFGQLRENTLKRRTEQQGKIKRILITYGATDPFNMVELSLCALNNVSQSFEIDIIHGAQAPITDDIQQLISTSHHKITSYNFVENIAAMMAQADLCLGAGGTTSWERCCLALPALTVSIADNQDYILQELHRSEALYNLDKADKITLSKFEAGLQKFLDNPEYVITMAANASKICDGKGVQRVVEHLKKTS